MGVIELKNLTKYYGKHLGIEDVNLTIEQGEIFGFVGPNGAGKSTTIRLILNLIFKTSGEAKLFGLDTEKDSKEIKKKIGYVPSEVNYYEFMKVEDILKLTLKLCKCGDKQSIGELCSYFELDKKRVVKELSFGNKKKLAVIQALIRNPELLILDEPTNGLDPLMQNRLFDLLIKLKNEGKTIFLSSHNLNEVERYCDRVAIIKKGKVILVDKVSNIITNSKKHIRVKTNNNEIIEYDTDKDVNEIMKELSSMELLDVEIRNTTLEEDFLEYYEVRK